MSSAKLHSRVSVIRGEDQVSSSLTNERVTSNSTAAGTADGVSQTLDFNLAVSEFERSLIVRGVKPVSQANLVAALRDPGILAQLKALRESESTSLLSMALVMGKATKADRALIVRSVRADYSKASALTFPATKKCPSVSYHSFEVEMDVSVVSVEDGEIVWSGVVRVRATDLLELPMKLAFGGQREQTNRDYGHGLVVVGANDGAMCGFSRADPLICAKHENTNVLSPYGVGLSGVLAALQASATGGAAGDAGCSKQKLEGTDALRQLISASTEKMAASMTQVR